MSSVLAADGIPVVRRATSRPLTTAARLTAVDFATSVPFDSRTSPAP